MRSNGSTKIENKTQLSRQNLSRKLKTQNQYRRKKKGKKICIYIYIYRERERKKRNKGRWIDKKKMEFEQTKYGIWKEKFGKKWVNVRD
jgi:hypothetical protein